jgi:hypothetical protein
MLYCSKYFRQKICKNIVLAQTTDSAKIG